MMFRSIFILSIILAACVGKGSKKEAVVPEDNTPVYFPSPVRGLDINAEPSIQTGILLDSSSIPPTSKHTGIEIIIPVSSHPWLAKKLREFRNNSVGAFLELVKDDSVFEEYETLQGYSMLIEPQSLFQTDSVLSFIMEYTSGYTGMPSGFTFHCFNFDNRNNREIKFEDFFDLKTRKDSMSLLQFITLACCNDLEKAGDYKEKLEDIPFGFDTNNVYFCFEKYHPVFWGDGIVPVKKKYLLNLIKKAFR